MKKVIIIAAIALGAVGCSKNQCSTCKERYTQTPAQFCGDKKDVDTFEETLHSQGNLYGQKWDCSRSDI